MPTERDRIVRERAYAIWVENGRQEGRSDEHWLEAEREIQAAAEGSPAAGRRPQKARGAPAAPAKAAPAAAAPKAKARPGPRSGAGAPAG